MSDYIPEFITDTDYKWAYCPYCDYSPLYHPHRRCMYDPKYKRIWTCACGKVARKKGLFERRDMKPWYIKRTWRKQYYKHDGRGSINEYMNGSYIGTYPVSQHLDEMMTVMPIDMRLGLRI